MSILIDNYNEGLILKNDTVYFHYSHQLNNVKDGGALFYFKNDELKNVMFTISHAEIREYFFSHNKYGNFIKLKPTSENLNDQMIEIKLPRAKVSLNPSQTSNFQEILSAFENLIQDKMLLQANREMLENITSNNCIEKDLNLKQEHHIYSIEHQNENYFEYSEEYDTTVDQLEKNLYLLEGGEGKLSEPEKYIIILKNLYLQSKFLDYNYLISLLFVMCIILLIWP